MKSETQNAIIRVLKSPNPNLSDFEISANMRFCDIPEVDSIAMLNFQIDMMGEFGEKALGVVPTLDMTIEELADLLEKN